MRTHTDLIVWQQADALGEEVFNFSRRCCIEQDRGMRNKLGMCAGAVAEELAEGFDSGDRSQFRESLHRAKMWAMELSFHLRFVATMGCSPRSEVIEYLRRCDEVSRRIGRLQQKLGPGREWSIED